jgi:hypothetical protein
MSKPRPNGDYQESSTYETSDFEDDDDNYSDLHKADLLRENDMYGSGVHAALLRLGHDMGMQGISCEKGIEHLLLAIITLQESETYLLQRQEAMQDEITQLVAMIQAMRKKLQEQSFQAEDSDRSGVTRGHAQTAQPQTRQHDAPAAPKPPAVPVTNALIFTPRTVIESAAIATAPGLFKDTKDANKDAHARAHTHTHTLKESSRGQEAADVAVMPTPRGVSRRDSGHRGLDTPRKSARERQANTEYNGEEDNNDHKAEGVKALFLEGSVKALLRP